MHFAALHTPSQIQLNKHGNLKHFLTIEGLSKQTLTKILDTAQSFFNDQNQLITNNMLEGRTVMNLFFENSTFFLFFFINHFLQSDNIISYIIT